jgi:prolyl oligopeptidase
MTHLRWSSLFVATLVLCTASGLAQQNGRVKKFEYPAAPTSNQVDDYHGVKVADPYRPLEDPDSAATRAWIDAENKLTFSYLEQIPAREKIRARMRELQDYERFSVPQKKGKYYFYSHNSGLQNQSVLYWLSALNAEPKVLLDTNALSSDGTVAVGATDLSDSGELLAYSCDGKGSAGHHQVGEVL